MTTNSGTFIQGGGGDYVIARGTDYTYHSGGESYRSDSQRGMEGGEVVVTAHWRKQKTEGNPIASLGLQYGWGSPKDWDVSFSAGVLGSHIIESTPQGKKDNLVYKSTYQRYRIAIAVADVNFRRADKIGIPGLLSPGQIYDYHAAVLSRFGMSPSAFGGSFLFGSRIESITFAKIGLWCGRCDK